MTTTPGNTLTNLIPTLYEAADTVAREQVGFIPAVYIDAGVEEVAKDQVITYPVVGSQSADDITPAATGPDTNGQTVGNGTMTISKSRAVTFPWNGEEQKSIAGIYDSVLRDQFAQAMRTLINEIEVDLFLTAKRNASRAYGTAGATPFGTAADFSDFAQTLKILKDNGAPGSDLHMVLNTTAGANIRGKQSNLFKVNEAGDGSMLRDGNLGTIESMMLHESGQIVTHTKGTGTGWVFNGTHAVNIKAIVAKSGANTLLYGDILTFEDDTTHKYVANTTLLANAFTIGGPGLLQQQTDGKTITIGNSYLGNWAFHRNAIHLLTRLPAMPQGGDSADDVVVITDAFSGLSFQVALYRQYRQVQYQVAIAWGTKGVKSDFIATLLG